ncbi:hypothetical protein M758_UG191600 [Ceratodon purpureus]|nr:hypothetical protein M758_UG191600 [Ceratodon purpureus]
MQSKSAPLASPALWKAVHKAFATCRNGLLQTPPATFYEMLRQPIFANSLIRSVRGLPWGCEPMTQLHTWQKNNMFYLCDLWDYNRQDWRTLENLRHLVRARDIVAQRDEIVPSIPWDLRGYHPHKIGDWVTFDLEGPVQEVYHIYSREGRRFHGQLYQRLTSELLIPKEGTSALPWGHTEPVRIIVTGGEATKYNPPAPVLENRLSIWLYGTVPISRLPWDPAEWHWKKLGREGDCEFFSYTTKLGYKIALHQIKPQFPHVRHLRSLGYTRPQISKVVARLWHPWVPRKICSMHWLILNEGLPIGTWRHKAGWESTCRVCRAPEVETAEHALMRCPTVAPAWQYYADLRGEAHLPNDCTSWHRTLYGSLLPPGGNSIQHDQPWGNASNIRISPNTAWDILRVNLLWNLLVQKCGHELNDTSFSLGKALYHA